MVLMRKILLGLALVLIVGGVFYLHFHHSQAPLETAYVGTHELTLWSTTAQVRAPVSTATFGDRLEILKRFEDQVQVRSTRGTVGWVSERDLISADLWLKARDLDKASAIMPTEARGVTKVISNLHLAAGRDSVRIRQLDKGVPLDLLERRALDVPNSSGANDGVEAASPPAEAKREDWWLVRAHIPEGATLAGWMLGRFIDLNVPEPLPDYATSADMRIVAWFELNHVSDATGHSHPQYLLLGTKGPEGQPCDFNLLRVYTWSLQRQRYETAYVESDFCGKLPIHLAPAAAPGGDASFSFQDISSGAGVERKYHMHQTIVRRERDASDIAMAASRRARAR